MVPVCCHLIVFVSAFYRYFVFSLAVSCHFAWLSVCLSYLSSWAPSASIEEIRGCNTFVSKLLNQFGFLKLPASSGKQEYNKKDTWHGSGGQQDYWERPVGLSNGMAKEKNRESSIKSTLDFRFSYELEQKDETYCFFFTIRLLNNTYFPML